MCNDQIYLDEARVSPIQNNPIALPNRVRTYLLVCTHNRSSTVPGTWYHYQGNPWHRRVVLLCRAYWYSPPPVVLFRAVVKVTSWYSTRTGAVPALVTGTGTCTVARVRQVLQYRRTVRPVPVPGPGQCDSTGTVPGTVFTFTV